MNILRNTNNTTLQEYEKEFPQPTDRVQANNAVNKKFVYRSVRFCIPTIIDNDNNLYTISSIFKDISCVDDLNAENLFQKWLTSKMNNMNVTLLIFKDIDLTAQELKNESFIYHNKKRHSKICISS